MAIDVDTNVYFDYRYVHHEHGPLHYTVTFAEEITCQGELYFTYYIPANARTMALFAELASGRLMTMAQRQSLFSTIGRRNRFHKHRRYPYPSSPIRSPLALDDKRPGSGPSRSYLRECLKKCDGGRNV